MNWYERIINWAYNVVIYGTVLAVVGFGTYFGVKKGSQLVKAYENQEAQLQELYENQIDMFQIMKHQFGFSVAWLKAITDEIVKIEKKPSYEYLRSVTLYMFQPITESSTLGSPAEEVINLPERRVRGYVGTAVIVAERDGFFYILTNKHICNINTFDKCYTILDDRTPVKLEFVKQAESAYDLSLWRTPVETLPGKQVINGLNMAYPQDNIYSVGQYLGHPYIYTEGTVGGYQDLEERSGAKIRTVIENMSCTHGCSGSGVFNKGGELVGLCFAGNTLGILQEESAKILAIDGDVIALFLKEFYGN
jgi:S1-C subfamily serine protease